MKKRIFLITTLALILSLNLISAINLDISSKSISNLVITDLKEPATFELTIRNLGETDSFEIYSLVGISITPESKFTINSGDSKKIEIQAMPQNLKSEGSLPFEYTIKNSKNEIQKESLTINIVELGGAFSIIPESINPRAENIRVLIENKANLDFPNIKLKMDSAFFEFEKEISLKAKGTEKLDIPINKEKLKKLDAGTYLINTQIKISGETDEIESMIKFLAQEDIETIETKEGVMTIREEIIKKNLGNVHKTITITTERNLIAYLFTTLSVSPTETNFKGFKVNYFWEKEIIPNEEFKVIIKTNWFYPIIVLIFILVLFLLIKKSVEAHLILRKKVDFIKTKGGQFALKITLRLKAKKFIERINIIDKLPPLVKLYERFGVIKPNKIDLQNKRIEWNIESLNKDEERIFTYIIYSKIGVIGKFELPSAKAIYEKEGKIKETTSNRSFFINEPNK